MSSNQARNPAGMKIEHASADAYKIPTDGPEADGTLSWDSTTLILVRMEAGGCKAIGYSYADAATAILIRDKLIPLLVGQDAMATGARWHDMMRAIRNLGRPGISSMAISAVDAALWDLKAKALGLPLAALLGMTRPSIPVYGSGGFTNYPPERLRRQLGDWAQGGMQFVKMKIGGKPDEDVARVRAARDAIGDTTNLFVDANGAYERKQALQFADNVRDQGVAWFEEPVSSDDLAGLRLLRDQGPPGMAISAGEYGYDLPYFRRMLEAQAVDILQADATRCGGITGFLGAAALCEAFTVPLSSHCAPTLHLPLCCAAQQAVHLEYFYDHVRIEHMLFDGAVSHDGGRLAPDMTRPGLGIEFREKDAQCYKL
jgi:L-alanine-DL-glutamate epimerase-like enolase superfamily enzyme